ncbi:cytochrome P450, partial [Ceratobasidium sp. AG-I]
IDWSNFVLFERYGDLFRTHRRMLNTWLNKKASQAFIQKHEYHTRQLLQRLLECCGTLTSSEEIHNEFYRTTAATILHSTYGYRVETSDDPFVAAIKELVDALSQAILPTNFLVNVIPALVHVPEWFPGAGWKRKAREWREMKEAIVSQVYQWTKDRIVNGTAEPSIIRSMLNYHATGGTYTNTEENMKQEGIVLFAAGADTLSGALQVFVLAMLLFPEAQARAQQEIDATIGFDRLPNVNDRVELPYVRNLVQEVLRWQPPAPMGVPHACYKDDIYRGYHIPKGTIVFGNVWAITRNEHVYKDPESFNPDRFLDPSVPPAPAFGWGRRKCPGLHYAEDCLFVCIASMLASFTLSKAKDGKGEDVIPSTEGTANAALYHPKPFKLILTP